MLPVSTGAIKARIAQVRVHIEKTDAALVRAKCRTLALQKTAPPEQQNEFASLIADLDEAIDSTKAAGTDTTGADTATDDVQKQSNMEAIAHNAAIEERNKFAVEIKKDRAELAALKTIIAGVTALLALLAWLHFDLAGRMPNVPVWGGFSLPGGLLSMILIPTITFLTLWHFL